MTQGTISSAEFLGRDCQRLKDGFGKVGGALSNCVQLARLMNLNDSIGHFARCVEEGEGG